MSRRTAPLVALVVLMGVSWALCAPRKPARLEVTDPAAARGDYALQGEFVGEGRLADGDSGPAGAQVVALGDGKFAVVVYAGGLPGDGWQRGDDRYRFEGRREGKAVKLYPEARPEKPVGTLSAKSLSIDDPRGSCRLKKTLRKSPTLGKKPPQGAVVLFAGQQADALADARINELGNLWAGFTTKDKFASYTLHLEFMTPYMPYSLGQARGNSGVYLHDCYELQVLDSFGLEGADNECGGFYKLKTPDVNMCLPPLVWQTYDIEFTAPEYEGDKKVAPGRVTVVHNGVTIHQDLELVATPGRDKEGPAPRPIHFQEHGNKVQYRNLWLMKK